MITTTFEDPDIEEKDVYNRFGDIYYKGVPFTGRILTAEESVPYKEGFAEGKYELRDTQGRLIRVEHFERGQRTSGEHYYSSGKLRYKYSSNDYQRWNWQGNLISECKNKLRKEYFSNGSLKMETPSVVEADWAFKFYNRKGNLICTQQKSLLPQIKPDQKYSWGEAELIEHYADLLRFDNPELREDPDYVEVEKQRMHIVWLWIESLSEKTPSKHYTILQNLQQHPENAVRQKARDIARIKGLDL